MSDHNALLTLLRKRGVISAAEVRTALGISPATLSRLARRLGDEIVRLGSGRASRYALRRVVAGLPAELPIYRVDPAGHVGQVGLLVLLANGEHWLERKDGRGEHFDGLPPVVHDMAPQGFLGRRFSDANPDLQLPPRLQDWSDDQRLAAVARRLPEALGDLVLGEESLERHLSHRWETMSPDDYPELAREQAEGGAGSSAGGEQPKFAAFGYRGHVLVKFTGGDGSPVDRRWRDLLACEATALAVLRDAGIPAVEAELLDVGPQRFLETRRFDRVGEAGRREVLTLGPLDDELYGRRDSWTEAALRLSHDGLLSEEDERRIRLLDAFGELIANTDRHFGNVSFFADGLYRSPNLALAPAYDMLPMRYAPAAGMVPEIRVPEPRQRAKWLDVWDEARGLAREFWARVRSDERISPEFRAAVTW